MAINKNGQMLPFIGKIGDKVYYNRHGKNIVRSITERSAVPTPAEQEARANFANLANALCFPCKFQSFKGEVFADWKLYVWQKKFFRRVGIPTEKPLKRFENLWLTQANYTDFLYLPIEVVWMENSKSQLILPKIDDIFVTDYAAINTHWRIRADVWSYDKNPYTLTSVETIATEWRKIGQSYPVTIIEGPGDYMTNNYYITCTLELAYKQEQDEGFTFVKDKKKACTYVHEVNEE